VAVARGGGRRALLWPAFLALLLPVIPFSLEMYALGRLTTSAFGTLMCLEPAIAVLAGLALLGQVPRVWSLAGVAFVIAAGLAAERTGARTVPRSVPSYGLLRVAPQRFQCTTSSTGRRLGSAHRPLDG
jgi:hypothetical protein